MHKHIFIPLGFALALAGCAVGPERPAAPATPVQASLQKARAAEAGGNHVVAAREYQTLALATATPKRYDYSLDAAAAFVRGNHLEPAARQLDELRPEPLTPAQRARHGTLAATLALAQNNPRAALDRLAEITGEQPPPLRAEILRLRANAFARTGNLSEAARTRVQLATLPADAETRRANEQVLWQILMVIPQDQLQAMRAAPPPAPLSGWADLALVAKLRASDPGAVERGLREWRRRYPSHPASEDLIASFFVAPPEKIVTRPARIALLLPLGGSLGKTGAAVRDGFLAAHFARADRSYQPVVRVYDTGSDAPGAAAAYDRAIAEGAEFIIGPLSKDAVSAVLNAQTRFAPTLALNYTDEIQALPRDFFQFSLSPEDEARAAAERAWLDGNSIALMLVPEGDWGGRIGAAFRERWTQLGGRIAESQTYPSEQNDFSAPLQRLLNIDKSEARYRTLKAAARTDIKFEPRRRQDAGFVFLGAFPRQARQIRPQLKFYYAADLPVYATSQVYTGAPDPEKDRDMDGVLFTDIPWLLDDPAHAALKKDIQTLLPETGNFQRLYALGVDAYELMPDLARLHTETRETHHGATGELWMDAAGRIRRNLPWARFEDGAARVLRTGGAAP